MHFFSGFFFGVGWAAIIITGLHARHWEWSQSGLLMLAGIAAVILWRPSTVQGRRNKLIHLCAALGGSMILSLVINYMSTTPRYDSCGVALF